MPAVASPSITDSQSLFSALVSSTAPATSRLLSMGAKKSNIGWTFCKLLHSASVSQTWCVVFLPMNSQTAAEQLWQSRQIVWVSLVDTNTARSSQSCQTCTPHSNSPLWRKLHSCPHLAFPSGFLRFVCAKFGWPRGSTWRREALWGTL